MSKCATVVCGNADVAVKANSRAKISVWALMRPLRPFAVLFGKRKSAETDRIGQQTEQNKTKNDDPGKGNKHSRERFSSEGVSDQPFVLLYGDV